MLCLKSRFPPYRAALKHKNHKRFKERLNDSPANGPEADLRRMKTMIDLQPYGDEVYSSISTALWIDLTNVKVG